LVKLPDSQLDTVMSLLKILVILLETLSVNADNFGDHILITESI
jgi:hypothetical protein